MFHSVSVQDTVARYGGDEFVMSIESDNPLVMESVMMRIDSQLKTWNTNSPYAFDLSLSAGYVTYNQDKHKNFEDLFREADLMMFKTKDKKRNPNDNESRRSMEATVSGIIRKH